MMYEQQKLFKDFSEPYLTSQIIAYIGNKRRLLPLLHKALASIYGGIPEGGLFLDLFAGSGVVSRFAKYLGFRVVANDWEPYSYITSSAYILTGKEEAERSFDDEGGLAAVLDRLNSLPEPQEDDRYISTYYSTRDPDASRSDYKTERLFYTRSNGLAIDKIRNEIERKYTDTCDPIVLKKKTLLIALLVYEAATHTNTSGVFKACHKGFGGHGKDALKRICADIRLSYPVLVDSEFDHAVFMEDANLVASRAECRDAEVAYLDPPYNQHQYGSNYHLLNTIALWDKPYVPLDMNDVGRLVEKAGIRKDWVKTRSDYCCKEKASRAFESLLSGLSARNILVSYSTDGIIPFGELVDMCGKKGRVSIETDYYTKYRGGKQSNSRENANIEFVLTIRQGGKNTSIEREKILDAIQHRKLYLLLKKRHCYERLCERFSVSEAKQRATFTGDGYSVHFKSRYFLELSLVTIIAPGAGIDNLVSALAYSSCTSKEEELDEIFARCRMFPGSRSLPRSIPSVLKKLAHKKNKRIFYAYLEKTRGLLEADHYLSSVIKDDIERVSELAEKRFSS